MQGTDREGSTTLVLTVHCRGEFGPARTLIRFSWTLPSPRHAWTNAARPRCPSGAAVSEGGLGEGLRAGQMPTGNHEPDQQSPGDPPPASPASCVHPRFRWDRLRDRFPMLAMSLPGVDAGLFGGPWTGPHDQQTDILNHILLTPAPSSVTCLDAHYRVVSLWSKSPCSPCLYGARPAGPALVRVGSGRSC